MQLKRRHTMKRAWEFALVRNHGASAAGRFLVLSTAPLPEGASKSSHFGLIATKRVGHAVHRNQLRRRLRELLRAHGDPLSIGLYVVIIVRHRAIHASFAELRSDLLKLISRCKAAQPVLPPC